MTRLAALFAAVVAGDYAVLRLIYGHLTDFSVSAAVCVGCLVTAGVVSRADKRRRHAMALGRAAVWRRRDQEAATVVGRQCTVCGGARQKPTELPRFVDRQLTRLCEACASALNLGPAR
jgi:hypothetical protein